MVSRSLVGVILGLGILGGMCAPWPSAAQDEESSGPPVHEATRSVEVPVGQDGAILRLGNGMQLLLPPGLPIGNSRILTLEATRRGPRPVQVHRSFRALGPAVRFNGAINATRSPLVLSLTQRRFSSRRDMRLVLVSEEPGLCQEHNQRYTLAAGLCSSWRVFAAEYVSADRRVQAQISVSGGYRMQFGWLPEAVVDGLDLPAALGPES